ncbi:fimbrial protein [Pseudenterobacter timonensis]|uniref:Fimbrial protein n=1 Tax=Pseudenterobacter timonensis TaxID=1755099 RepID=A0AAE4DPQ6_9ENTR|nr:fimbrial protein [Pseudenterobacter timonensis]MDR9891411.1 fimbrial protein [Pseudenterobacter timonensis]
MKKIILGSLFLCASTAYADRVDNVQTEGVLSSQITMTVADITCHINQGLGISQQIHIPTISTNDLRTGNTKSVEVPLMVDCQASNDQPGSIAIHLVPAGVSTVSGDHTITTSLDSVGLELAWKDTSLPALIIGNTEFTPAQATNNVWDLSLIARPVLLAGKNVTEGNYNASLAIKVTYY